jgi:hypothetical protein
VGCVRVRGRREGRARHGVLPFQAFFFAPSTRVAPAWLRGPATRRHVARIVEVCRPGLGVVVELGRGGPSRFLAHGASAPSVLARRLGRNVNSASIARRSGAAALVVRGFRVRRLFGVFEARPLSV